jgi:hypothetical protein
MRILESSPNEIDNYYEWVEKYKKYVNFNYFLIIRINYIYISNYFIIRTSFNYIFLIWMIIFKFSKLMKKQYKTNKMLMESKVVNKVLLRLKIY